MGKVSTNEMLTTYRILDATIGYADLQSPFNWGADGAGHDVKLFGAAAGAYLLFDTSENSLALVGIDLDLSASGTGVYDFILKTNVADALSITDGADLIVFDTTTGAQVITITPAVSITGALSLASDIDMSASGTGTYDLILKDAVADALSIRRATTDMMVFDSSTPKINITPAVNIAGVLTINGGITMGDAQDIATNATTGTKIGTATSQKIGFWNATPVIQQAHIADPTGGGTQDAEARTAINAINALCATLGLTAAS